MIARFLHKTNKCINDVWRDASTHEILDHRHAAGAASGVQKRGLIGVYGLESCLEEE